MKDIKLTGKESYFAGIELESDRKMLLGMIDLGIEIILVSEKYRILELSYQGKKRYMIGDKMHLDSIESVRLSINKQATKDILQINGISVPEGFVCSNELELEKGIAQSGMSFPLVVKPVNGQKAEGVFVGANDYDELRDHFIQVMEKVKGTRYEECIVEQHLQGKNYRVLVIGGRVARCIERIPACIVGDGKLTIEQLIYEANSKKKVKAFEIVIDERLRENLDRKGKELNEVLPNGVKLCLRNLASLSTGGTIKEVKNISEVYRKVCEQAATLLGLKRAGIDIIAPDITSKDIGNYGIIEVNSDPGFFYKKQVLIDGEQTTLIELLAREYFGI